MTTASDAIPATTELEVGRRGRTLLRFLGAFSIGVVLGGLVIAGGLLVWDATYQGRVLPGVAAHGVDLSGLDHDAAVAALAPASAVYGEGRVVVRTAVADRAVPYTAFGRSLDREAMVGAAMRAGREGTPLERAIGQVELALHPRTVESLLALDRGALETAVAAELLALRRAPIDATIQMAGGKIVTTPAAQGRTFDAATAAALAADAAGRLDAPAEVVVGVATLPLEPARSDTDVAAARADAERVAADLTVKYGSRSWTIPAKTVRTWTWFEGGVDGSVRVVIDPTRIDKGLAAVAKGVKKSAVSASFLTGKGGKVVGVTPSQEGRQLDVDATAAAIVTALQARVAGNAPGPVSAAVTTLAPKVTTEEARKVAPLMTMLGSWKTWFPISERNHFGANIWLPAKYINGTVLAPGQRFEWWSAIGPVTAARGFGLGGIIKSDHTEPTGAIGGGMCSSSTTLFNAALRAGLQMGARSNHKYYINRYPLGLDATVSGGLGGGQTMTFTNDTGHPIVIKGYRIGGTSGKGWVRYEIWGIPDGRKVSLSAPVVRNVRKATTNVVYTSRLPHGAREQTEFPSDGKDVWVTRTVRAANGRVIHQETFVSHYMLWNGRIEVGS